MKKQTNYLLAFYNTNKADYEIDAYILEDAERIIEDSEDIIREQFNNLVKARSKVVLALFDENKEFRISYNPNKSSK